MVGIVLVSHSYELAHGLAALASQVAGTEVRVEPAGGGPDGSLGTTGDVVRTAIARADCGRGAETVAVHDLAVEEKGHGCETDMRMRPHVDPLSGVEFRRPEMIEENERADHAAAARGASKF